MATNIGRLEFLVDADGRILERNLRRIGRTAGAAGGSEAGKGFNKAFDVESSKGIGRFGDKLVDMFAKVQPHLDRLRNKVKGFGKDTDDTSKMFDRLGRSMDKALKNNEFQLRLDAMNWGLDYTKRKSKEASDGLDGLGRSTDRNGRLIKSHVGKTIAAWTLLILAIGEGTASLGSGVGASLTALISSVGLAIAGASNLALIGIGGLVAVLPAAISMFGAFSANGLNVGKELNLAFKEVGDTLAQILLPNMNAFLDAVRNIAGSNAYLEGTAKIIGGLIDGLTKGLNSPGLTMFIEALAGPIGDGFIKLGSAIGSVIDGLGAFAAAGGEFFNQVMGDLEAWAEQWAEKMNLRANSGGFDEFFEKAYESINAIFGVLNSLGDALGTVFMAGADTGNSMLNTLQDIFDEWNEWMQTVEGQNALAEWFENGEKIFDALLDLAGDLGSALGDLVTPESVDRLTGFMDALGDFLPMASDILSLFGKLDVLTIFAEALNLIGTLLAPIMPGLMQLAEVIGKQLVDGFATLQEPLQKVGEFLAPVIDLLAVLAEAIFPVLFDVIDTAIEYITNIATAFSGAEKGTKEYEESLKVFGDVVKFVMEAVGNIVKTIMDAVGGIFMTIAKLLTGDFAGAWDAMYNMVSDILGNFGVDIDDVIAWVEDMYENVADYLEGVGKWFSDVFKGIGKWFEDFGKNIDIGIRILGEFLDEVGINLEGVLRFFTRIFEDIGDWFDTLGGWINDAIGWFGSLFGAANNAQSAANKAGRGGGGGGGGGYASGGILNGPRRILAGEAGPEAIVPLRRNLNDVDPSVRWLSAFAQNRMPAMAGGGMVGSGKTVNVEQGAIVVQEAGDGRRAANDVMTRIAEYVSG